MKQTATVISAKGDRVTVRCPRRSACSGNCGSCGGCSVEGSAEASAYNAAGATVGDRVTVEISSGTLIGYAVLVYLLPVTLGLAAAIVLLSFPSIPPAVSYIAAAIIFVVSLLLLRRVKSSGTELTVTEVIIPAPCDDNK